MTVEEAVPQEELQRGEFFANWMRSQDFQHGVRVQIGAPDTKGLMLGVLRSFRVDLNVAQWFGGPATFAVTIAETAR